MILHKVHKIARLILDKTGIKEQIRKYILLHTITAKKELCLKAVYSLTEYIEKFENDSISDIFIHTISDITKSSTAI